MPDALEAPNEEIALPPSAEDMEAAAEEAEDEELEDEDEMEAAERPEEEEEEEVVAEEEAPPPPPPPAQVPMAMAMPYYVPMVVPMQYTIYSGFPGYAAPAAPMTPVGQLIFGSYVKLRHELTGHRLHSHGASYPEGSGQQQVTCFAGEDFNDWWLVKGPHDAPTCEAVRFEPAPPPPCQPASSQLGLCCAIYSMQVWEGESERCGI